MFGPEIIGTSPCNGWVDLLKVALPTLGAIVVFITWRSGKAHDLMAEFYEQFGTATGKIYHLRSVIKRNRRMALHYLENLEETCAEFSLEDKFRKALDEKITAILDSTNHYSTEIESKFQKLERLNEKMNRKWYQPIFLRTAGNRIGIAVAINAEIRVDQGQIEDLGNALEFDNIFEVVFSRLKQLDQKIQNQNIL